MSQPQPITTTVTWFPGGAQRDSDGESVPWPWGESKQSPELLVVYWRGGGRVEVYLWREDWEDARVYCRSADLEPPKWGGE